jgi:hypothetical protein
VRGTAATLALSGCRRGGGHRFLTDGTPIAAVNELPCGIMRSATIFEGVIVLSHDDRHRLAEIERGLYDDDPPLARRFDAWSLPRDWRWLAFLLLAIGIGGAVAGTLALSGATIVLLGFVPVAAGIALWYLGES